MTINKALTCGVAGNEISKSITGTSEVSASRTFVATGSGAAVGALVSTSAIVALGVTAPVAVPLTVASGVIAGIASLFD
tara:strand:+ start:5844 stop:6080 length:237 start_codon:yes stop_codon:yes gene_type:complete